MSNVHPKMVVTHGLRIAALVLGWDRKSNYNCGRQRCMDWSHKTNKKKRVSWVKAPTALWCGTGNSVTSWACLYPCCHALFAMMICTLNCDPKWSLPITYFHQVFEESNKATQSILLFYFVGLKIYFTYVYVFESAHVYVSMETIKCSQIPWSCPIWVLQTEL